MSNFAMNTYIVTCWHKSSGTFDVISTFLIRAIDRDEAQRHLLEAYKTIFGDVEPGVKDAYKHGQFFILKADNYTVNVDALQKDLTNNIKCATIK